MKYQENTKNQKNYKNYKPKKSIQKKCFAYSSHLQGEKTKYEQVEQKRIK